MVVIVAVVRVIVLVAEGARRRHGFLAVLEVRQRADLGMRFQPAIDEQLDDLGPAQRGLQVGAPAGRLEVRDELGVLRAPGAGAIDLGLDGRIAGLDALGVGHRRQDEQDLDPVLGRFAPLGVQLVDGLLDRLQVGGLLDALLGQPHAQLVVHDLDLALDEQLGDGHRRVGHGELDDALREDVPRPIPSAGCQPARDVVLEVGQIAEAADGLGEGIVRIGQVGHPKLAQRDRELDVLAGQRRLAIVGREGQRERPLLVLDHALERLLEARDHAVRSQPEGVALGRAALEGHAVTPPDEADDRVVALLGAATLDRHEAGVLLAELVDDALDLLVVDLVDVDAEGVVGVGAELDLRSDRQHDAIGGPLPFDEADPLRLRDAQDVEIPLRDGLHDR